MPAEPIISLIETNLIATLKTITTGAGYHVTLLGVEQEQPEGVAGQHLHAVVTRETPSEREGVLNFVSWDYPFTIVTPYLIEGQPEITLRTAHEWIHSDIYIALRADETRGGYAIDTTVTSESDGDSVRTTATVWYRHKQDDPCSQV